MTNKPINVADLLKELVNQPLQVSKVSMNKADFDDLKDWGKPCELCGMPGVQHANEKECEISRVIDV